METWKLTSTESQVRRVENVFGTCFDSLIVDNGFHCVFEARRRQKAPEHEASPVIKLKCRELEQMTFLAGREAVCEAV